MSPLIEKDVARPEKPEVVLEAHEEDDNSSFEQYESKSDFKFVPSINIAKSFSEGGALKNNNV